MNGNENTGKYISYLARRILKYTTVIFSKYDLSSIEYTYIMILYTKGSMTQQKLSKTAMVDKAQTTRAINSLLNKGYITKGKSDLDKRSYSIGLSRKGMEIAPTIENEIELFEAKLNKGIDQDIQRVVKRSLIQMIRNLQEVDYE